MCSTLPSVWSKDHIVFVIKKKNPPDAVKHPPCKEQEASKLISANTAEIVQL